MAGFSELIKNFEKTRDYVRDFFIYGYKVRNDFDKKSARTYDDEKRRVESWLGDYLVYDDSVRGKQVAISVDSAKIAENPLYQAFYTRSFTDNDIRLHFLLLDIMCDGEQYTARQLTDMLYDGFQLSIDEQTVRNKLKEYEEEGIMLSERRGRAVYFRLSGDFAEDWLDSEGLIDAVSFFSEMQEFGLAGNSMLKMLKLKNELFFMKHYYIVHALEDEVMLTVLDAMEKHKTITVKSFSRSRDKEFEHVAVPLQVLSSVQTGRRFLAAWLPESGKFFSFRLDYMPMPKIGGIFDEYDEVMARYRKLIGRCFGVSLYEVEGAEPLKLVISADEEKELFIVDRLRREKRCGSLEKTGMNEFTVTLDICDPNEAMKWVKTFIGRIKHIEGGTEEIRRRFNSDIDRMYQLYGGDGGEDIQ
ncbi:WYL domain-containing protein [uncultured Ruminococcus sp.]|uniref:WYL domain-containing protein n=1 Tax=uncultured Ruminococcus sp. TaxID=165186 RepID=UPI0025F6D7BA|nr:WYL domain-containing protein [uncultured Ruminococcus sp.]